MTNRIRANVLILALSLTLVAACGKNGDIDQSVPQPSKAVVKIAATGTVDPGILIGGITVTVVLPSGVTIKAIPDTQNPSILVTDPGMVTASGVAGAYAAAFATVDQAGRNVHIQVYNQNGFDIGEFVTLTCDIVPWAPPAVGSFGLGGFTAKDLNGADINGLSANLTVKLL